MKGHEIALGIIDYLREHGPSRSLDIRYALAPPCPTCGGRKDGPSQLMIQNELWAMNAEGVVTLTPDSRWQLVEDWGTGRSGW